jgi:UDP-N-acetylmuramoylalanine--D-glutamate ligase
VVGLAETGLAAGELLLRHGWEVSYSEQRPRSAVDAAAVEAARARGQACHFGGHRPENFLPCERIVLSPGVPAGLPVLAECRARGIEVIGEIELARRHLPGKLVTVTGTKGKSSTVAVIEAILRAQGDIDFEVGGHACKPLSACSPARDVIVAELACYQMEAIERFFSDIHVVTNVFPDHTDRYPDFRAYFDLKTRICLAQGPGQVCVLPEELRAWAAQARVTSRVLTFSMTEETEEGCRFDAAGQVIHYRSGDDRRRFSTRGVGLIGNRENLMAAVIVGVRMGIADEVIQSALDGLRPLPHRMETIHDDGRVRIVDDSACNNAPALGHLLDQLAGPVRLLTLNCAFDVEAFAGRVRVTRLGRDELERRLAAVLQELLPELERDGGTLVYAPGVPIAGGDPAAYMALFADAVRSRW